MDMDEDENGMDVEMNGSGDVMSHVLDRTTTAWTQWICNVQTPS